jgi:acyl-coenzyme A thioesterase PaaI-like protein
MSEPRIEHLEDFTAHGWCNALLFDPSITRINQRNLAGNGDEWNSLFTRSLFTDGAVRAFLNLYKPGKGQRRVVDGKSIVTGKPPILEELVPSDYDKEVRRQAAKEDVQYNLEVPEAPENTVLVSLGRDLDGGVGRLHGGVTASLLDQSMGALLVNYYENRNVTTELRIKYKKAVETPCILKARVRVSREVGRWIEVVGWLEDGEGTVYAEGWASFVLAKLEPTAKI